MRFEAGRLSKKTMFLVIMSDFSCYKHRLYAKGEGFWQVDGIRDAFGSSLWLHYEEWEDREGQEGGLQ